MFFSQCPKCEFEGSADYSVDDPAILRCSRCGHIYSYIWCDTCGMGGDFIENINDKPASWTCEDCHTTLSIPIEVYSDFKDLKEAQPEDMKEVYQEFDATSAQLEKHNAIKDPYRQPLFFGFGVVTVFGLGSAIFVSDISIPMIVMMLGITAMFGYVLVMGYKTGIIPTKSGVPILREEGPVYFNVCLTFVGLAFIFLVVISMIVIIPNVPF